MLRELIQEYYNKRPLGDPGTDEKIKLKFILNRM